MFASWRSVGMAQLTLRMSQRIAEGRLHSLGLAEVPATAQGPGKKVQVSPTLVTFSLAATSWTEIPFD